MNAVTACIHLGHADRVRHAAIAFPMKDSVPYPPMDTELNPSYPPDQETPLCLIIPLDRHGHSSVPVCLPLVRAIIISTSTTDMLVCIVRFFHHFRRSLATSDSNWLKPGSYFGFSAFSASFHVQNKPQMLHFLFPVGFLDSGTAALCKHAPETCCHTRTVARLQSQSELVVFCSPA